MTHPFPEPDGTPLPDEENVLRFYNKKNYSPEALEAKKALPTMFTFSSKDLKLTVKRLSVWAESQTSALRAWELMGCDPQRSIYVVLKVAQVRALVPESDCPTHPGLDVVTERAMIEIDGGELVPDNRPGAGGHAGIANLDAGTKTQIKSLRTQLADLSPLLFLQIPVWPA